MNPAGHPPGCDNRGRAGHPWGSAADCLASAVVTGLNRGWAEGLQRPDRAGLVGPVRVGIDMAGRLRAATGFGISLRQCAPGWKPGPAQARLCFGHVVEAVG